MAVGEPCRPVMRGPRSGNGRPERGVGRDRGVDCPPVAQGASGGRRGEQGESQRCADVESDNSSKYCVKYCELQHCAALHRVGWTRHLCWSILGLMSANSMGKTMEACLKDENCENWLFWQEECNFHTLLYWTVLYTVISVLLTSTLKARCWRGQWASIPVL